MTSIPEIDQNPLEHRAQAVGSLLGEVIRSLRFYAGAGYSGGDCSIDNRERIRQWGAPDGLSCNENLSDIVSDPRHCERCSLRTSQPQVIPGTGLAARKLMFVLGYPSFSADTENTPYAGEAGKLLARIVSAMSLTPDDVCVSYIVRCRPTEGREPSDEEARRCLPFLEREVKAVAPDVICALGGFSARHLLGRREPLESLRGTFYERYGARIIPTWHPDDMLADPDKKRPVWADIQKVMRCLDIT